MSRTNQNDHWEDLGWKSKDECVQDRIAETERVKERKRARVERGAGDVPMVRENRDDEEVAVRHADASAGDIRENPAQPDKLRKTVRFEQEASSASASLHPTVTLEYPASGATQSRPGSVLCADVRSC